MNPSPFIRDPQLGLFEARPTDANVVWLETFLKTQGQWVTADGVLSFHCRQSTETQKRIIRKLANASEWIIQGQFGYKHLEHATAEEVNHAANALESQAKAMGERAARIRRNGHKIFG